MRVYSSKTLTSLLLVFVISSFILIIFLLPATITYWTFGIGNVHMAVARENVALASNYIPECDWDLHTYRSLVRFESVLS